MAATNDGNPGGGQRPCPDGVKPMPADSDCLYHADRARIEAVRAIESGSTVVAAIHQEMCLCYCGRVIAAMLSAQRLK